MLFRELLTLVCRRSRADPVSRRCALYLCERAQHQRSTRYRHAVQRQQDRHCSRSIPHLDQGQEALPGHGLRGGRRRPQARLQGAASSALSALHAISRASSYPRRQPTRANEIRLAFKKVAKEKTLTCLKYNAKGVPCRRPLPLLPVLRLAGLRGRGERGRRLKGTFYEGMPDCMKPKVKRSARSTTSFGKSMRSNEG